LDLGAQFVRVVEVEWNGGQESDGHVVRRGMAPLPPNVWNDLNGSALAFAGAIRDALSSAGIHSKNVVACLPRRLVTLRFAQLPKASPEQLRGMVSFEAQQYILFPLEEVTLDYYVVTESDTAQSPGEEEMQTILLAAARRSLIADLMLIFDRVGLELQRLTVSSLALAEHARYGIGTTALIDVEPGEMDVAVVADGRLLFTRASALDTGNPDPAIRTRRLAEEVARSFAAFQNEFRHSVPGHIYLSGPDARSADALRDTLADVLETQVGLLPVRLSSGDDITALPYATAIGTALQQRPDSLGPINLVPNERAEKKARAARNQRRALALILIGGVLLVGAYFALIQFDAQNKERRLAIRANEDLNNLTRRLDALRKQHTRSRELVEELETALDRKHPTVDILYALGKAMPRTADIWFTQLTFDRENGLTMRGESKSESAATDLVISLQGSGAFRDVKLGYLGDAQTTQSAPRAEADTVPPMPSPATGATAPPQPLPGMNTQPGTPPGGPTPGANPTAPQTGGTPPSPNAAVAQRAGTAARPTTPKTGPARTTFVITCKVNRKALSLVAPEDLAKVQPPKPGQASVKTKAKNGAVEPEEDEGGDLLE
jgi:Tfp pilus assembly PilM family ATPase/Tfp pilus assembly protein PilN